MLLNILLLLVILLVVRGIARLVRWFLLWLGRGRRLDGAVDMRRINQDAVRADIEAENAAAGVERLTRAQQAEVIAAQLMDRELFLADLHVGWYQVVIIFVIGSMAGLVLEELWMLITAGLTQSRVGLVWGPFSPLYGFGAVLLTLVSFGLRERGARDWQVFLASLALGGALEQLTGWGMQTLFSAESWTYAHLPDHITQWVAWRFLVAWGLLGLVWAKLIMPEALYRIGSPTTRRQVVFVVLLAAYLALDILMTVACFQRRAERDAGIPPLNAFEAWVDVHYTDEFMSNRFQNLVVGREL
ncbi:MULTISPECIES: putative ABC transporter permease [unclassified Olsenella]|uniref:putative ABC transporter permease n=1 Tax=Olsenella TaxID=133925 RepID=UPI000231F266|nr:MULTISPECIES: putative ABC transporter permease [unclassified Olsenella]EHF02985.1 hypothetical protein HMPREF1008_00026 [Olsenella sp. oral taxon 809 str. F0356]KXB63837.1 hypothetical protein HMPREF1868_00350 [Olsenella sp. DNF00959]